MLVECKPSYALALHISDDLRVCEFVLLEAAVVVPMEARTGGGVHASLSPCRVLLARWAFWVAFWVVCWLLQDSSLR